MCVWRALFTWFRALWLKDRERWPRENLDDVVFMLVTVGVLTDMCPKFPQKQVMAADFSDLRGDDKCTECSIQSLTVTVTVTVYLCLALSSPSPNYLSCLLQCSWMPCAVSCTAARARAEPLSETYTRSDLSVWFVCVLLLVLVLHEYFSKEILICPRISSCTLEVVLQQTFCSAHGRHLDRCEHVTKLTGKYVIMPYVRIICIACTNACTHKQKYTCTFYLAGTV